MLAFLRTAKGRLESYTERRDGIRSTTSTKQRAVIPGCRPGSQTPRASTSLDQIGPPIATGDDPKRDAVNALAKRRSERPRARSVHAPSGSALACTCSGWIGPHVVVEVTANRLSTPTNCGSWRLDCCFPYFLGRIWVRVN